MNKKSQIEAIAAYRQSEKIGYIAFSHVQVIYSIINKFKNLGDIDSLS